MSRRPPAWATWAIASALLAVLGAGGGLTGRQPQRTLAAPLAAPDGSVVLQPFVSGLSGTVLVTHAGDGTGRLFVVERDGRIMVVKNGAVNPTPFLDLSGLVTRASSEQGLLGLAFHPRYEANGRFFVFYTAKPPTAQPPPPAPQNVGDNTLAEYHVSAANPDVADPVPVRTLLAIPDRQGNHNGGMIAFGPDGYLYLGTGDEGGGGDPFENAQDLTSLYGKLLRIDVDTPGSPAPPGSGYAIPPTNPFFNQTSPPGVRQEIWAYGFRNPWRWSFDRLTGDIFVGDVGQNAWEEIDVLPAGVGGLNFGWDDREGAHCYEPPDGCLTAGRVEPILEYSHAANDAPCASIVGGYRYRGAAHPTLQGVYFYADTCSGQLWKGVLQGGAWRAVEALNTDLTIVSFGEDESGELYVVDLGGAIFRLMAAPPTPTPTVTPTFTPSPTPTPLPCTVRPRVTLQTTRINAHLLEVVVSATTSASIADNQLRSLSFTQIRNARVTIGAQVDRRTPFVVTLPNGIRSARFTVQRDALDQPMHVDLVVTDLCGPWSTFVGAGIGRP